MGNKNVCIPLSKSYHRNASNTSLERVEGMNIRLIPRDDDDDKMNDSRCVFVIHP